MVSIFGSGPVPQVKASIYRRLQQSFLGRGLGAAAAAWRARTHPAVFLEHGLPDLPAAGSGEQMAALRRRAARNVRARMRRAGLDSSADSIRRAWATRAGMPGAPSPVGPLAVDVEAAIDHEARRLQYVDRDKLGVREIRL